MGISESSPTTNVGVSNVGVVKRKSGQTQESQTSEKDKRQSVQTKDSVCMQQNLRLLYTKAKTNIKNIWKTYKKNNQRFFVI